MTDDLQERAREVLAQLMEADALTFETGSDGKLANKAAGSVLRQRASEVRAGTNELRAVKAMLAFASPTPEPSGAVVEAVERAIYDVDPFLENNIKIEWGDGRLPMHHTEAHMIVRAQAAATIAALASAPRDWTKEDVAVGAWLSAALDDPKVCDAMKADINAWFASLPTASLDAESAS